MSLIIDLCTDIAEALTAHEFSMKFTAHVEPVPRRDIQGVRKLEVFVFPDWETRTRESRDLWTVDHAVNIGVMKHIELASRVEEVCKVMNLVDEITRFILDTRLPHVPQAQPMRLNHQLNQRPYYFWEHLQQYSTFTSVLSVVYKAGIARYGRA